MADEVKRAVAIAVAVVVVVLRLPILPLFALAGAMTPRDEERGHFEW